MTRRGLWAGAVLGALLVGGPLGAQRAASQDATGGLELTAQNFAVVPGGTATFEFIVTASVPEIAPPTTTTTTTTTTTSTTTTTTTSTTTTSTTTTLPGATTVAPPPTTEPETAAPATSPTATTTSPPTSTTTTTTVAPGPVMTVQVRSHRALASRESVDDALTGAPGPILDLIEFDLDDVSEFDTDTGQRRLRVDVPITERSPRNDQLELFEPGVHPITVQIRRDGSLVASATTIVDVVRPDGPGRGPFTFAVLARVPDSGPLPSDIDLTVAARRIERAAEVVRVVDAPVTVGLPPTYLRVPMDEPIEALADALTDDDRLLTIPAQPLDPSAATAAQLDVEVIRGFGDGDIALGRRFPTVPTTRAGWIVDDNITDAGATVIRNLGIPMLVVPNERYLELDGNLGAFTDPTLLQSTTLDDGSAMRVAVVDPVSELLAPEAPGSPIERAVRLMAEMGALRYQLDPDRRALVLTTPDIGVPDPDTIAELAGFVDEHPDFGFSSLGQLPELAGSLFIDGQIVSLGLDAEPSYDLVPRTAMVQQTRLQSTDIATMLPDNDERPASWDRSLRTALSTGLTDDEAASIVGDVDSASQRVVDQIVQPEPFSFTIAGNEAEIPLRVENRGSTPLLVRVHAESDKLVFPMGDLDVVLEPNQTNNVDIPVEARSNGVFPVDVEVQTPTGNAVTEPVELTARVSTLTGLGRVFTVGAILVLASWWFSYFRRRRNAQRRAELESSFERHPTSNGTATPG